MNCQIAFHIIELLLFVLSIVLIMMRNSSVSRTPVYKYAVLIIIPLTIVGGIALSFYDDIILFSGRADALLRLVALYSVILVLYVCFRKQYRALDVKYRRFLLMIVILLSWACFI